MLIRLQKTVPFLLAIALLWYVLRDISFADLLVQFRRANYGFLLLTGLFLLIHHAFRAARWQQMLWAAGYRVNLWRALLALLAGMLASMVVPGAGELTRCATLKRTDDVPLAQGLGSVVAERVFDLLMLFGLLGLTFILEFNRLSTFLGSVLNVSATANRLLLGGILGVAGFVGVAALWWIIRQPGVQKHPLFNRVTSAFKGLAAGLTSIRRLAHPGRFVLFTMLIQAVSWLAIYTLLLALPATHTLPVTAALLVLTASSVGGLAVPTQGGIGTYHFMVSRVLVLYGLTLPDGVVAATFQHAVMFGINLLLSAASVMLVPLVINRSKSEPTGSTKGDSAPKTIGL